MPIEEMRDPSRNRFWPNEKHLFPVALIHQSLTDYLPHYAFSGRYAKNPDLGYNAENFPHRPFTTGTPYWTLRPRALHSPDDDNGLMSIQTLARTHIVWLVSYTTT